MDKVEPICALSRSRITLDPVPFSASRGVSDSTYYASVSQLGSNPATNIEGGKPIKGIRGRVDKGNPGFTGQSVTNRALSGSHGKDLFADSDVDGLLSKRTFPVTKRVQIEGCCCSLLSPDLDRWFVTHRSVF